MVNKTNIKIQTFRFIKFIGRLGLFYGIKVWLDIYIFKKTTIIIPNVQWPIFIRPNTSDKDVFFDVFIDKQYGFPLGFVPKIIIDAGANIGLSAIYFANVYKDTKLYCIEIEQSNFKLMQRNTSMYENIFLYNAAIWYSETTFTILDNKSGHWGFSVIEDFNEYTIGQKIKAITIEQIIESHDIDFIDILKIDVEGAEKELFSKNYELWLPKTKVIMIEFHDRMKKGCSKSVFEAINKYDFSMEIWGELLIFINNNIPYN